MLASRDGKIVCENTLDARLDVVFRKKLPEVLHFVLHKYIETAFINCFCCFIRVTASWIVILFLGILLR